MKGVLLAGGTGSRLGSLTRVTNKHLLPVHDRPMIAYPLSNLLQAGIRDVFIVTGGEHFDSIGRLLGSGRKLKETLGFSDDVSLSYGVQDSAGGIAQALGLAREFAGGENLAVILGDNIYERTDFLKEPVSRFSGGAHLFLKEVPPERLFEEFRGARRAKYGMAELDGDRIRRIDEKPVSPATRYAVTGAYLYGPDVWQILQTLKPSWRGELEITDVNNAYVRRGAARFSIVSGEWTDAGTIEALFRAGELARKWKMGTL